MIAFLLWAGCAVEAPHPVDLGRAAYPASVGADRDVDHVWGRSGTRLRYALGPAEEVALEKELTDYAAATHYRPRDEGFAWQAPPGCGAGAQCAMELLVRRGRRAVEPISARFRAHARSEGWTTVELAESVVAFVQAIPYAVPDEPFGLVPPALVAWKRAGDCDSKALLAHLILRDVGVDSVVFASERGRHAVLGVAAATPGHFAVVGGRRYALTEVTGPPWRLGQLPRELIGLDDWRPRPLRAARIASGPEERDLGAFGPEGARGAARVFEADAGWPTRHVLRFSLSTEERAALLDGWRTWARRRSWAPAPDGAFTWVPPAGCGGERCIYEEAYQRGRAALRPLVERLLRLRDAEHLGDRDLVGVAVGLAQALEPPADDLAPFGMAPLPVALADWRGSLPTKAVLALLLTREVGVEAILVRAEGADGALLLGAKVKGPGATFRHRKRTYLLSQVAHPGPGLGEVPGSLGKLEFVPVGGVAGAVP